MSVCLSCGHQRDSCEICGGDLEDAHVYCDALRAENERLKNENIVRITALNNLHDNLRELQRRNAKLEKNNSVLLGIIRRLALNPDNAFALRAEADTLAELEGE